MISPIPTEKTMNMYNRIYILAEAKGHHRLIYLCILHIVPVSMINSGPVDMIIINLIGTVGLDLTPVALVPSYIHIHTTPHQRTYIHLNLRLNAYDSQHGSHTSGPV